MKREGPIVTFYGDDFTGSTDALAQYYRFGMKGLLLFDLPNEEFLRQKASQMDVVGIAGISRSLPVIEMQRELRPIFQRLLTLKGKIMQYKLCSTFDSSQQIGNLGVVIKLARELFAQQTIPIIAAQPDFGRYTLFGNHFVQDSTEKDTVYRLDQHPGISKHPTTPMTEGDLLVHLRKQTNLAIRSINLLVLRSEEKNEALNWSDPNTAALIFDTLDNQDLIKIASTILPRENEPTRFVMGSGGISYGLGHVLHNVHSFVCEQMKTPSCVDQLVVVSGSAAKQTEKQIRWAIAHGWQAIRLDVQKILEGSSESMIQQFLHEIMESLSRGRNVVVYTALGPDDPEVKRLLAKIQISGIRLHQLTEAVGRWLGKMVQTIFEETDMTRIVIAGGDTSSYTVRAIDSYGLEIIGNVVQNGALCKLRSTNPKIDKKEIMLKGGQVGGEDLFELIRKGGHV